MNNCINIIKLSINLKKRGFIIKNNKKNFNILKAFIKINVINFIKIDKNIIIAHINYVNNEPIFKNIINMFKPGHKKYINLKNLKNLCFKHNWILILSTNKGCAKQFWGS